MKEFSMTNCQRHSIKPNFSVPKGLASTSQGHPLCAHKPLCPTSRALALLPLGVITLTGAFRGSQQCTTAEPLSMYPLCFRLSCVT